MYCSSSGAREGMRSLLELKQRGGICGPHLAPASCLPGSVMLCLRSCSSQQGLKRGKC